MLDRLSLSCLAGVHALEKTIAKRLQAIRIEKGLSQGDIEKRTGLLRSYLSRVENGHTIPSVETLAKIAAALGVSISALVEAPGKGAPKVEAFLGDKKEARFWTLMRKFVPSIEERDRRVLVGLARRMARKR
jgi:transcriptional regulator with XRE-family HTH domain